MAINVTNVSGSANNQSLSAWDIHNVKLTSCECTIGESEKDGVKHKYYALDFNYEGENGSHRVRLFCPVNDKEGSKRRRPDNAEYEIASSEEQFILGVMHNISVGNADPNKGSVIDRFGRLYPQVDPTVSEEKFKSFCNSVKALATSTIIEPGLELALKLIGNSNGYGVTPSIVGISKDGNAYIRTNYIARADGAIKLGFNAKELAYRDKIQANIASGAAKASQVGNDDDFDATGAKSIDDINTDDI